MPIALLVRTWNLFHGNTMPPGRRGYLREMIEVATRGDPGVVCLQEIPVWAVRRLEEWSGMQAFPALTRSGVRPARSAGWVTRRHSGLLRSLIAGQANAILVARRHGAESLGAVTVSAPRRERRVCQAVRVDDRIVVGNTHLSHSAPIEEQDVELARCVAFLEGIARDEEALVLAGDLNRHAPTIDSFSAGADGIDHVLVRGAAASPAVIWAEEERTLGGRVLSDHAPVEVVVE